MVLRFAGGRHLPVLGVIHHRGRRTGRHYATPLGIRPPAAAGGVVMPLTFGEEAGWYRNVRAAGWCVITWRGDEHTVADPVIVDRATALPAFPRYERMLQLLRDALLEKRDVDVRYTVDDGGALWF
ncbi:MAG TPA: nitroreductase family deazaflavin-dependent oxidoreductase, partial [Streptosporangiaceae bacterium]